MIHISNLHPSKVAHKIIKLNINLYKGKIYKISGHNGSGKSSILKIIAGIEGNYTGKIELENRNLKIAYCPQILDVNHRIPIRVVDFLNLNNINSQENRAHFKSLELDYYYNYYIRDLSLGVLQSLFVLRSLLIPSDLILLDEPFSALDVCKSHTICELIAQSKKDKCIVFTDHTLHKGLNFMWDKLIDIDTISKAI